jgi:hypothetical protein
MKKKLLVLFFRLKRFSLKKENGISSYFLSLWKKRKKEPQHIPKPQISELDRALSRYSHVLPTDPTSEKYNMSIQEGFTRPNIGFTYTNKILLQSMTHNQSQS